MKKLRKHLRVIAIVLCVPFLLQSCRVYKSTSFGLEEAAQSELRVRLINKDGKRIKYYRITKFEDGKFYGRKYAKIIDNKEFIPIQEDQIQKVQLHNKKTSTIYTIVLIALPILLAVIFSEFLSDGFDVGGGISLNR